MFRIKLSAVEPKFSRKYDSEPIGIGIATIWTLSYNHPAFRAAAMHDAAYELRSAGYLPNVNSLQADDAFIELFKVEIDARNYGFYNYWWYRAEIPLFDYLITEYGEYRWPIVEFKFASQKEIYDYLRGWWEVAQPAELPIGYTFDVLLADVHFYFFRDEI